MSTKQVLGAKEAFARLRAGNERFTQNVRSLDSLSSSARRESLVAGQHPFAVILSCADSRVPSELVFDCGLGDLFVCRVAGNIAAPSIIGSAEFAATTFGTELVVVVGHTNCGAVSATLSSLSGNGAPVSPSIRSIVERIAPAVTDLSAAVSDPGERMRLATRANVRAAANQLRHGSSVIEQLISAGRLVVVGAEYELETGKVHFFDGADHPLLGVSDSTQPSASSPVF